MSQSGHHKNLDKWAVDQYNQKGTLQELRKMLPLFIDVFPDDVSKRGFFGSVCFGLVF